MDFEKIDSSPVRNTTDPVLSEERLPRSPRLEVDGSLHIESRSLTVRDMRLPNLDGEGTRIVSCLDDENVETIVSAELLLSEELPENSDEAYLYKERNEFVLAPVLEVRALQIERLSDERSLREVKVEPMLSDDAVVLLGSKQDRLGQRLIQELGATAGNIVVDSFPNSETRVEIHESVRDRHAFVVSSMGNPVNESFMETALTVQALKLAGARKVTVVMPYFGYSRQDRKADIRPPISAKAVTDILKVMGAHHLVTIDLHARQVEGFFDGPFDNLEGLQQLVKPLIAEEGNELLIVSPDTGGSKRAQKFATAVEGETGNFTPLVVMSKFRHGPGVPPTVTLTVGEEYLRGKTCVLVDDMVDTGGTILVAARELKERGAARVLVATSHGVFSRQAVAKLRDARMQNEGGEMPVIDRVYVTDTLPISSPRSEFLKVVSVAPLLAEAMARLDQRKGTLSELNACRNLGTLLPAHT